MKVRKKSNTAINAVLFIDFQRCPQWTNTTSDFRGTDTTTLNDSRQSRQSTTSQCELCG